MADNNDAPAWRRDSHYNQQRSSHPSTRSGPPSRPQSRPGSGQLTHTFNLDGDGDGDYLSSQQSPDSLRTLDSPSPAPSVPRVPQSKQSKQSPDKKARGKNGSSSRHSRGRKIEQFLFSDSEASGLDEIAAPVPVQNPHERHLYAHHTLEERSTSRAQPSRLSWIPPRKGTPATLGSLTALPAIARYADEEPVYSSIATELYTVSYLIIFAILGTLARLGVQWLTFYPGAPSTFPVLWANFGGTLFLAFLSQDRRLFREEWGDRITTPSRTPVPDEEKTPEATAASHAKVKKTIPLYIGLATGFCGSFTSFSSFVRDIFLAFVDDLAAPGTSTTAGRNHGYSFEAGLAVIIITIAVCFAALKLGAHIAILLERFTPTLPFQVIRKIIDPATVAIAWPAWLGAMFMAIWPPDRFGPNETWRGQAVFACVFAPLGCLLRYYVSLKLNPLMSSFPLGTFAVNIFGTAVLGMAWDLQHVRVGLSGIGGGRVGCQVLQGIMDGFDGCLTTVSTWMLEIDGLKRNHAYKYASASVAAGVLVLVVVMGSVRWSVGWEAVACVTGKAS